MSEDQEAIIPGVARDRLASTSDRVVALALQHPQRGRLENMHARHRPVGTQRSVDSTDFADCRVPSVPVQVAGGVR